MQRQQLRDVLKEEHTNKGLLVATPFKRLSSASAAEAASYAIGDVQVQVMTSNLEDLEEEELQRLENRELEESSDEEEPHNMDEEEEAIAEEELDPWDPFPLQWHEHVAKEGWGVRQSSYFAGATAASQEKHTEPMPECLSVYSLNLIGLEKWAAPRFAALITELTGADGSDCSGPFDFVCLYEVPMVGLKCLVDSPAIRRVYAVSDRDGSSFDKKTTSGTLVLARKDSWLSFCASPIFHKFSNTVMGRGCLTWKIRRTPNGKPLTIAAAYLEGKCSLGPKTRKLQLRQVLSNLSVVDHSVALVGDFGCYSPSERDAVRGAIEASHFSQLDVRSPAGVGDELERITVDESVALAMLTRKARRKPRTATPDIACLSLVGASSPQCESAEILGLTSNAKCPEGVFVSTHCPVALSLSWAEEDFEAVTGKRRQEGGSGQASKKRTMNA